jgi:hypothetical protein
MNTDITTSAEAAAINSATICGNVSFVFMFTPVLKFACSGGIERYMG